MAAGKGEVFLFQKITSVWLTGNGKDKRVALEIGLECCLCDDGQTMLQALPARLAENIFKMKRGFSELSVKLRPMRNF